MATRQFTVNSAVLIGFAFGIIACVTLVESGISPVRCTILAVLGFVASPFFMRRAPA